MYEVDHVRTLNSINDKVNAKNKLASKCLPLLFRIDRFLAADHLRVLGIMKSYFVCQSLVNDHGQRPCHYCTATKQGKQELDLCLVTLDDTLVILQAHLVSCMALIALRKLT